MKIYLLRPGFLKKGKNKYRVDENFVLISIFAFFESLECDDPKWHSQPKQRKKDKKRDRWLKKRGWTILRFGREEIKNNPESCVKILKQTIQNLGGLSL